MDCHPTHDLDPTYSGMAIRDKEAERFTSCPQAVFPHLPYNSRMEVILGTKETDQSHVSIDSNARLKHFAAFGKSGVGKTTLMRNMAMLDLLAGTGVSVVDPHGSLVEDLLDAIPRERINDVIYLNPADPHRVIGLNVLDAVEPAQRPLVVSSIISILRNLWPENWGPRTEHILSHCVYALLEQPTPVTLLALPRLLTEPEYRRQIVAHVSDPAIQAFFRNYESEDKRFREESISPLLNKLSKFTSNPIVRAVIGQPTSSIDFRRLMDSGQVLLCNLAKGALGEDVSSLLGSLVVTKLALASLSRQNIPEADRRPHLLYIDEVQNFCHGMPLPTILAESRKYRLSLALGTQTLSGLPKESVAAIFGNCATIASFRVSGDDAKELVREFAVSGEGVLMAADDNIIIPATRLQNLPDYTFFLRTLSSGRPEKPYIVQSSPPYGKIKQHTTAAVVTKTSRERFGRDRRQVERTIDRFLTAF